MSKIKLLELFAGIGAFSKALTNLNIPYELTGFSEIDKYATKSYCAIHGVDESLNLGDITKINERDLPDFDMLTYGFPCQDISVAGKQRGIELGTRSGLLYEALRIIQYKMPKYCIAENVKNLVGKKFKGKFDELIAELEFYGYNSYYKVLNAKDFGIPQNRERVFIISIRKDIDKKDFEWPEPFDNGLRLKDFLENEVDEKYYLSEEYTKRFIDSLTNEKLQKKIPHGDSYNVLGTTVGDKAEGTNSRHWVYDTNGNISTLDATMYKQPKQILEKPYKVAVKEATRKGYAEATVGDSINIQFPDSKTRRGRIGHEVAQTLETSCNQATLTHDYRIRKLTPKECWRLMGFDDEDFEKAAEAKSNSQLYKQAGNSIVCKVLEEIFKKLFK